ncbi:hypothetical protein GGX14DRAFT_391633 [Mycena pura]|uniref:Uncharacterized protein n=1 Tax=Mycena pura TaxID=153505 RepID=A0AAD6VP68_9AGAR|nr:hypothetical protein GGX14DRAFT_391633 [Mycena pura]
MTEESRLAFIRQNQHLDDQDEIEGEVFRIDSSPALWNSFTEGSRRPTVPFAVGSAFALHYSKNPNIMCERSPPNILPEDFSFFFFKDKMTYWLFLPGVPQSWDVATHSAVAVAGAGDSGRRSAALRDVRPADILGFYFDLGVLLDLIDAVRALALTAPLRGTRLIAIANLRWPRSLPVSSFTNPNITTHHSLSFRSCIMMSRRIKVTRIQICVTMATDWYGVGRSAKFGSRLDPPSLCQCREFRCAVVRRSRVWISLRNHFTSIPAQSQSAFQLLVLTYEPMQSWAGNLPVAVTG